MGLQERIHTENAWRKGPGISDGMDVEHALLGSVQEQKNDGEYIPFAEAVAKAKEKQPNPFDRSKIIKDLRLKIAERCLDKEEAVKFYTAVGTALDVYHGVDAFFEQGGRRVTVDVSMREKESYKADVLLIVDMDEEGNVVVSPDEIEQVSKDIARRLTAQ